ncbi:hypothetical protein [Streptomyces sp. NPDC020298]|uniref:hypothetical protein n=1 Tax=unclassified Streptomyces TaxID=2593676 RepID=UPI0033E81E77
MTGTLGSRTGRVRALIVDDEPGPAEPLSVAVTVAVTAAGRRPCPAADGRRAPRCARGRAPYAVVPDGVPMYGVPSYGTPTYGTPPVLSVEEAGSPDGGGLVEGRVTRPVVDGR